MAECLRDSFCLPRPRASILSFDVSFSLHELELELREPMHVSQDDRDTDRLLADDELLQFDDREQFDEDDEDEDELLFEPDDELEFELAPDEDDDFEQLLLRLDEADEFDDDELELSVVATFLLPLSDGGFAKYFCLLSTS